MKNREKYIDEIITMAVNGTCCRFMLDKVMPKFIDNNVNVYTLCEDGKCCECSMLFALWLDEEYEEPPRPEVDWWEEARGCRIEHETAEAYGLDIIYEGKETL